MAGKKRVLLFIYNSLKDPLFQNLVLEYIKSLSLTNSNLKFYLITFEQKQYQVQPMYRDEIRKELLNHRIRWYPLGFHTGRHLLIYKAWDFIQAIFLAVFIRIRHQTSFLFAFANVSAAFAIILKKILWMKMIIYSYEPHSEFMIEMGYWEKNDLKFKLLHYLEELAGRDAEYIMTGTQYMVDRLRSRGSNAQIFRAPTAVDGEKFYFRPGGAQKVRKHLKILDKKVVLYLGKFGGLYYRDEIPQFFSYLRKRIDEAFFLVATPNDFQEINNLFLKYLPPDVFHIAVGLPSEEIKNYLSVADMGLGGIPSFPSQRYRSPTKIAEYLLSGVPYITCKGISEDDIYAERYKVGVVLRDYSESDLDKNFSKILELLNTPKDQLRTHCREVGLEYRSKSRIDEIFRKILS